MEVPVISKFSQVLLYLLFLFLLALSSAPEESTLVLTSSGPIRGKLLSTASGMVTAFLGIPYAEPPTGKLRFQKPRAHQPWSHTLEATSFGNSCFQASSEPSSDHEGLSSESTLPFSENCLFLNIWVPHPQPTTPVPVFVWIHGGGFSIGSGSIDRSFLAAHEKIIVASMNYRLGALGFLSLPPEAPGNVGLWDQHLALSWLRENMARFGGDPTRITLGGQSAGAASVGFHLLSPASQNIFAQATLQSGATISPSWAWVKPMEAKVRGRTLGQILGCDGDDDRTMVACLQEQGADEIVQKLPILSKKALLDYPFVPTTDGDFLPDDPRKLLDARSFPVKPILSGFMADEGTIFLLNAPGFSLDNESVINYTQLLEGLRLMAPDASESDIEDAALIYIQEDHKKEQYRDALIKASGDYLFLCPVAVVASQMADAGSPVFAYYFTHQPSFFDAPDWIGVPHCAELPYLFGEPLSEAGGNVTYAKAEKILSQRVMQYWGHFVRNGTPDEEWPLYTGDHFFQISAEPAQAEEMSPINFCGFWELLAAKESTDEKASL